MTGRARRVVHLLATNFVGGPERQVLGHLAGLPRDTVHPVLGSYLEGRPRVALLEEAAARGIDTFAVATRRPWDPRSVRELRDRLRAAEAELLVCHGYKPDLHGHFACRSLGIPRVSVLRGLTGENLRVRFYERLYRWSLRRADRVVAVSRATASMAGEMGVPSSRVRVIYNAWYPPPGGLEPLDPRSVHRLPADVPVLVAAGRLSPEKGQDVLVRALALLARQGCRFRAVLYGDGPLRARVEELILRENLAELVLLAGFRPDARRLLAGADLVVNPSRSEGLPNVLLEAMAARVPVVATLVGGIPEMLEDGRTGWLVPPDDPDALARALAEALASPGQRARRAAAAARVLRERFGADRQQELWLDLYRDLLGPLRRAPGRSAEREGRRRR